MANVKVYSKTVTNANVLTVSAGSNVPQGGNRTHGARTLFRLSDDAATAWRVRVDDKVFDQPREIEIVLGGDCEAETFVEALQFAVTVLRGQIGKPSSLGGSEEEIEFN